MSEREMRRYVLQGVPVRELHDPSTGETLLVARIGRDWMRDAVLLSRDMAKERLESLVLHMRMPTLGLMAREEQSIRSRKMWVGRFRLGRWGR